VQCWGADGYGQLGNGAAGASTTPVDVTGLASAVAVAAGFHHSCAVIAGGSLQCWGRDLEGQLGDGFLVNQPAPVAAMIQLRVAAVSAGISHTCALTDAGLALCWGDNGNGQIGRGTVVGSFPSPVPVVELGNSVPVAVATGFAHSCALLADGRVRCWGLNQNGQLGTGTGVQRSGLPLTVSGAILGISAGAAHTCAVTPTGAVDCWGFGDWGRLGYGGFQSFFLPIQVDPPLARDAVAVAAGLEHSCLVRVGGDVACWGLNTYGQLGNLSPSQNPYQLVPQPVGQLGLNAIAVAVGSYHTCVIRVGGSVRCWGRNNAGQLGNSLPVDTFTPTDVAGVANATRITAGHEHTCVLQPPGVVRCWGRGAEGQLGDGANAGSATPVAVGGINSATSIAAGELHTCARIVGGTVRCWGRNVEGQLGNAGNTSSGVSVLVSGITTAVGVTAGQRFSCALLSNGQARCWGEGNLGQLGNGGFADANVPVTVSGLTGAVAIDAGQDHTCAMRTGQRAQCWGWNVHGELGDGTTTDRGTPAAPVSAINVDAAALAWSSSNTAVATVDMGGRVYALGAGDTTIRATFGGVIRNTLLTVADDTDDDGVLDPLDNCLIHANPDQLDTDGDDYGNRCDGDLNNSNSTNATDLALFRTAFGDVPPSQLTQDADLNGSGGFVNSADLAIFRTLFGLPPGPTGRIPQ
jgi:alpha-tubulin suppressor-like RCC1 family protein